MPSSDKNVYDDGLLARYLLGHLPAEQVERLDELSVVDEELAWRLTGIENDLVDAFVRGELAAEELKGFQTFYLSSDMRRQKVEFAAALHAFEKRAAHAEKAAHAPSARRSWWSILAGPRPLLQWNLAVAALAIMLAAGYLLTDNLRLRRQVDEARSGHANSGQREVELEQQLNQQRAANAAAQNELDRIRKSSPDLTQLKTVSVLLPPPTRGLAGIKTVSIHPATDLVMVLLALESDDFPKYRVTLKEPSSGRALWRSPELEATVVNDKRAVSAIFPAGLVRAQNYIVELSGIGKARAETIDAYPFRVVLR